MPMSPEELVDLEEQLHALLVNKGCAHADADEIIDAASSAAQKGIASMVAVAASAQERNRDSAIVLALYIMQRLVLSDENELELGKLPGKQAGDR